MTRALYLMSAAAVALLLPAVASAAPKHPHLHHAVHDIRQAIAEIEGANHTHFNRLKVEAIRDLKHALAETDKALAAIGDPVPPNFKVNPDHYRDYKDHKHLRRAEHAIDLAIKELKASEHFGDKKDHKEKAVHALQVAHKHVVQLIKAIK